MDEWINEKIRSRIPNSKGLNALDLGCGEGLNSLGLAKTGIVTTAVDKQAKMIELVKTLASKEGVEIFTRISTIQNFQSSTQYDIVLFTHVLHFLPRNTQTKIIKKIIGLVKPGGTLVFADIEDNYSVLPEVLLLLEEFLTDIELERFTIKDNPHRGVNYPHQHKVFYLIGVKKAIDYKI